MMRILNSLNWKSLENKTEKSLVLIQHKVVFINNTFIAAKQPYMNVCVTFDTCTLGSTFSALF